MVLRLQQSEVPPRTPTRGQAIPRIESLHLVAGVRARCRLVADACTMQVERSGSSGIET